MDNSKKIKWYALATMGFSTVWGFGNVLNGFYLLQRHPGHFELDHHVRIVFCPLRPDGGRTGFRF